MLQSVKLSKSNNSTRSLQSTDGTKRILFGFFIFWESICLCPLHCLFSFRILQGWSKLRKRQESLCYKEENEYSYGEFFSFWHEKRRGSEGNERNEGSVGIERSEFSFLQCFSIYNVYNILIDTEIYFNYNG